MNQNDFRERKIWDVEGKHSDENGRLMNDGSTLYVSLRLTSKNIISVCKYEEQTSLFCMCLGFVTQTVLSSGNSLTTYLIIRYDKI